MHQHPQSECVIPGIVSISLRTPPDAESCRPIRLPPTKLSPRGQNEQIPYC